jgi:tetratricopeptide (TPR) repeat protein
MRLEADTDNLRSALAWCSQRDPHGALELSRNLYRPWKMHGRLQELISWLEEVLATPAAVNAHTRASGLGTLGDALIFTDRYDEAGEPLQESLALFRELGDESGEASVLTLLGMSFDSQGLFAEAIDLHEESIAIARAAGDKPNLARALNNVSLCFSEVGDLARSKTATQESLAIYTELGDPERAATTLGGLAEIALAQGDHQQAERHTREALKVVSGLGDERNEMYQVAQLACAAALRRDAHSAGRLWAVAEATETRLGMRMLAVERARFERIVTPLRDDQAFQAGYQAGLDVDLAEAVRELRAGDQASKATSADRASGLA